MTSSSAYRPHDPDSSAAVRTRSARPGRPILFAVRYRRLAASGSDGSYTLTVTFALVGLFRLAERRWLAFLGPTH